MFTPLSGSLSAGISTLPKTGTWPLRAFTFISVRWTNESIRLCENLWNDDLTHSLAMWDDYSRMCMIIEIRNEFRVISGRVSVMGIREERPGAVPRSPPPLTCPLIKKVWGVVYLTNEWGYYSVWFSWRWVRSNNVGMIFCRRFDTGCHWWFITFHLLPSNCLIYFTGKSKNVWCLWFRT